MTLNGKQITGNGEKVKGLWMRGSWIKWEGPFCTENQKVWKQFNFLAVKKVGMEMKSIISLLFKMLNA